MRPAAASATAGRRLGALAAPAFATLVALAILLTLGIWQLERKAWKEGLLAQIASRAYAAPGDIVPESGWQSWEAAADEFRRVRVTGVYLDVAPVAVHGLAEERRGQAMQGYYLFSPLRREDGSVVIVNRGFVPTERLTETLATLPGGSRRIDVTGLVRSPERRAMFVPENDPQKNEWFVRSIADIAAFQKLDRVAPFYLDADNTATSGTWPRGGQTQLTLRNHHLEYALTWFGLALTLLGVFAAFAAGRWRGGADPGAGQHQAGTPVSG